MSISLAGKPKAKAECPPHEWDIVAVYDINPATGKPYGTNTPGTCRKCRKVSMFDSTAVQATKDDFIVGEGG